MATIVTRAGKGTPLTTAELDLNFTNLNTDKLEAGDALGTPASVTLTNATGLPTAGLVDNAVTDPKLRDSAGLSVMGRGANSTGDPADIVAGTNKQVLRREGSDLAFGAVDLASNQAVTGTLPVNQGGTGITSFGSGVAAFLGTPSSANLAAAVTDETGTGALVFANSPTLVTPALGTPASGVATNLTGTASGLTAGNVTTNANLTGAVTSTGNATVLGSFTSANLAAALTDETGTGAAVFATSPTLVTPALGTPSALVGTNITGTAAGLTAGNVTTNANLTGAVTSTGNATVLGSFSSANLAAAVSDETGSGAAVFATNATLVNPALGTPASGVATNLTGTAAALTAGNVTTNANLTGAITSTGNATLLGSFTSANLAAAVTDETGTGAAVFGTNPVIDGVTVPARTNPLQLASRVAMTGAASGSRGWLVQDNVQVNFGTGDFTLHWEGSLPDWTPAVTTRLIYKYQNAGNRIGLSVLTSGELVIFANKSTSTIIGINSTVSAGLSDNSHAKIDVVIQRETSTAAGSVVFYVNGVQLGTSVPITAAAAVSLDNPGPFYVSGSEVQRFESQTTFACTYNRALSAAEVLSLCVNGVALADVGASQVPVYESDFSAGVDGFIGLNSTVLGNVDSIGGENDWLKVTATATSSARTLKSGVVPLDKLVLVTMQVFVPSTNVSCDGVLIRRGGASIERFTVALDTIVNIQSIFPAGVGTSLDLQVVQASGTTVVVSVGDEVYIKNVITKQIGATLNLSAQDAQSDTGQVFDRSGNGNHALLPAAGATIIGRPTAQPQQVRWTNTWDGTHELQYIGGVNQAILPANAYIESIVGVVTGATPHDIIIGNGSDADRYVTITTGLAAGVTSFALASRVTDGTNLKLTVDPDTNSDMSIAWVITYTTLES